MWCALNHHATTSGFGTNERKQLTIVVGNPVPGVILSYAVHNGRLQSRQIQSSHINRIDGHGQVTRSRKKKCRTTQHLPVEWIVVRNDDVSATHGFQQRRVCAANTVSVKVRATEIA